MCGAAGTAGAAARTCEVDLALADKVTLGSIQMTIDYSIATGSWLPKAGGGIACYDAAPNTLAPFVDDPVTRSVAASFISLTGIPGPGPLAQCFFVDTSAGDTLVPSDFVVYISDATREDGRSVTPPRIVVSLPDCGPTATTTTTTTTITVTTTTLTVTTTTVKPTTTTTLAAPTTTLPGATTTTSMSTSTTSTAEPTTTSDEPTTTTEAPTTTTTIPFCGDGFVEGTEQCDDGNTIDGDGCSSDCTTLVICGDANDNDRVSSGDALTVLRAATGQPISCPLWRCDADGDQHVRASDSLRVLKRAVGQSVKMECPQQP
ncbi:MAG TPA: myxococcus cysteine-rich repeat containing protein [Candidatus Binatia bacterium]